MDPSGWLSRRQLLAGQATALALVASAGCADRGETGPANDGTDPATDDNSTDGSGSAADDGSTADSSTADGSTDGSESDEDDGSERSATDDLDLREANVVDVAFEEQSGSYAFEVTLHHDDDGEDGYANWWQIERLDGTRLGRRELLHAHSRQPFTRSETIEIPDAVNCVVVHGHDQTHGYGGVAAVVDLDSGAVRSVDQGTDRQSFDADDCP